MDAAPGCISQRRSRKAHSAREDSPGCLCPPPPGGARGSQGHSLESPAQTSTPEASAQVVTGSGDASASRGNRGVIRAPV